MQHYERSWITSAASIKFIVVLILLYCLPIGLSPDEAQYWVWGQNLDFGYYSKPPLIAWQIKLTTMVFGDNAFGVRIGSAVLGFFSTLFIFRMVEKVASEKEALLAAFAFLISPFGFFASLAATTDSGMITFIIFGLNALFKEKPKQCLLFLTLATLYKWTALLVLPTLLLFPHPFRRDLWRNLWIVVFAFLPTLWWNIENDFPNFKHVYSQIVPTVKKGGNFWDFLGSQIGLLGGLYFILMLLGYGIWAKRLSERNWKEKIILLLTSLLLVYLLASFREKMQANWALWLYPPAFCLIGVAAVQWKKTYRMATVLSLLFISIGLMIPLYQMHQGRAQLKIPYSLNLFRQSIGWDKIAIGLNKAGYRLDKDFLLADTYQMASILSFYAPGQNQAFFFNLGERRRNQFDYWQQLPDQEKKCGFFVAAFNDEKFDANEKARVEDYLKKLAPYFEKVEFVLAQPLFISHGKTVKGALIFKCSGYNGKVPATTNTF